MDEHGVREDVAQFTGVHDEHFIPKCAQNPSSLSPYKRTRMANLGSQEKSGLLTVHNVPQSSKRTTS